MIRLVHLDCLAFVAVIEHYHQAGIPGGATPQKNLPEGGEDKMWL